MKCSGQIVPEGYEIDHKDTNSLNNLENNLRVCTKSQNAQNKNISINKFGNFKGVSFHKKANKWQSSIYINGKFLYLGSFDDEKDAAKAYNKAASEYFGEFANLNIL